MISGGVQQAMPPGQGRRILGIAAAQHAGNGQSPRGAGPDHHCIAPGQAIIA